MPAAIMPNDPEKSLMWRVRNVWGASIAAACKAATPGQATIPQPFLAALVGNESGGDPNAKRFEKGVLASLWEVLLGRKTAYGSIDRAKILAYIFSGLPAPGQRLFGAEDVVDHGTAALQLLDGLATSHGLTQVMGYEVLDPGVNTGAVTIQQLLDVPAANLQASVLMLGQFARRFQLDPVELEDAKQLFDCWNTGRTHAPTADPQYIPRGMARMDLYADLLAEGV